MFSLVNSALHLCSLQRTGNSEDPFTAKLKKERKKELNAFIAVPQHIDYVLCSNATKLLESMSIFNEIIILLLYHLQWKSISLRPPISLITCVYLYSVISVVAANSLVRASGSVTVGFFL